jgi:pimeloyl-ACP methyl ester carboxylesterase
MSFIRTEVFSVCLKRNVSLTVILPDDAITGVGVQPPYKTLYMLHGYSGEGMVLATYLSLRKHCELKGIAIVLPDGYNSFYIDHPERDENYSRFIGEELVAITRRMFPLSHDREDTYIGGISMGGYGALRTIGARMNEETLRSHAAIAEELAEQPDFHGDPAVRACALFAPATFFLDPARSEDIGIPTLWFCGSADNTVHYAAVRDFCERADHSDRVLITYEGCGHNIANNAAPPQAYARSWDIFKRWSDPVWDTLRLNNANCHFLTAFMDLHLRGDAGKAAYLRVPVTRGAEAVYDLDAEGRPTEKHTGWKGFTEGTAAGIRLETF